MISTFRHLVKSAKDIKIDQGQQIKVAVLGDHAIQFFCKALSCQLILAGFRPEIYEGDYNQIDSSIINSDSTFYSFQPEFVIIFETTLKLRDLFYEISDDSEKSQFANDRIEIISRRMTSLRQFGLNSKVLYYSYELFDDQLFGNYFANVTHSFYYQLFQLNSKLLSLTQVHTDFHILEINKYLILQQDYRDWALYINSDVPYKLDFLPTLTHHTAKFITTLSGRFKKCLILDLDNTLWGGIIGDDGLDNIQIGSLGIGKAFSNLQKWIKSLKNRGIILAVCSKNNEMIAKEPFEKHPEMILRLSDISVFIANWDNKADNIRSIHEILNIGFDSMVFLDDNPAEREIIKQNLTEITVPDLPEDPALFLPFLISLNLFDTASYSKNDLDRTHQYQQESERKKLMTSMTNMDDYLSSLNMQGVIEKFLPEDVSRIAQLTQRSNQFNLRTIRYTEREISEMMISDEYLTYSVKLKDKFGDYGLISVVILKRLSRLEYFIDTWIMSCRVLKRGVESFVMSKITEDLKKIDARFIKGQFVRTKKNGLVEKHYEQCLFEMVKEETAQKEYIRDLNSTNTYSHFIT